MIFVIRLIKKYLNYYKVVKMNKLMNTNFEQNLPLYKKLGYKGHIGACNIFLDEKDGKFKKVFDNDFFEETIYGVFLECDCGNKFVKDVQSYHDDNKLKKMYCYKCGNSNFLINPIDKDYKFFKVEENENVIKVYKIVHYVKVNRIFTPFIKNTTVTGYFISKKNGTIQKALIKQPLMKFNYEKIYYENDFLLEYVLPLLLKDTHKEFESLNLNGTNFSLFTGKNKILNQEDFCKKLFKNTYTKSVKRELFQNLNNKNLWENENHLLIYKAIGKYFKDTNNVVKVLKATFFLEQLGSFQREMSDSSFEFPISTSKFIDYFFDVGIIFYGENRLATNISKLDYENTNYISRHLIDFTKLFKIYSKIKMKNLLKEKDIKFDRPLDIFKGLHDFGVTYYDFINTKNVSLMPYYTKKLKERVERLNKYGKKVFVEFRLPKDSTELKFYGVKLNNCVTSYRDGIIEKKLHILGIFYKDKLFACAELNGYIVVQLRTFNNYLLNKQDLIILEDIFNDASINIEKQ